MFTRQDFEGAVRTLAAALAVAWTLLAVDGIARADWDELDMSSHLTAGLLLYSVAGAIAGLTAALAGTLLKAGERALGRHRPVWGRAVVPLVAAIAGPLSVSRTAFWMFSGEGVQETPLAAWGPYAVLVAVTAGATATAVAWRGALERAERGERAVPLATVAAAALAGALLARIDLTVYVSLYSKLHTVLELSATLVLFVAVHVLLRWAAVRRPRAAWLGSRAVAGLGSLAALVCLASPAVRGWVEESLRHVWREPVYAGRMLSRAQILESYLRDPRGWNDVTMSNVHRLRQRYDLATTARSPMWDQPLKEPPWLTQRLRELRGTAEYNIVVYYVDTLRADTATDPAVMPNAVEFAKRSLSFRNAYTTGSDTVHALPGITGGSYDLFEPQPNDFLKVARQAGMRTALVAAQSAREFLTELLPAFEFDETVEIADYAPGNEDVWGYGADQPTARPIVEQGLEWLHRHSAERSLLWLFNFDVHNWRELDEAFVRDIAKTHRMPVDKPLGWRYRVVAKALDLEFGRFLAGLDDLGLSDKTIVLFVSDHGEGLGRDGFWVHSIFLWEGLIRVPLALRVPGMPPRKVHERVSLVDLAPTLCRYLSPDADTTGYHGEDLLSYLVPGRPKRRLPILFAGANKEQLVRLGIIEDDKPYKLILSLEGGLPELYDLATPDDPDARDVAREQPAEMLRLLNQLVRAPLFPRLAPPRPGAPPQGIATGAVLSR